MRGSEHRFRVLGNSAVEAPSEAKLRTNPALPHADSGQIYTPGAIMSSAAYLSFTRKADRDYEFTLSLWIEFSAREFKLTGMAYGSAGILSTGSMSRSWSASHRSVRIRTLTLRSHRCRFTTYADGLFVGIQTSLRNRYEPGGTTGALETAFEPEVFFNHLGIHAPS